MEYTEGSAAASAAVPCFGTLDELALLHAADPPVTRKRTGRPPLGGRSEVWTTLEQHLVRSKSWRTKNGLPGVPYAVRALVTRVKQAWSAYVPGVEPGAAPPSFAWLTSPESVRKLCTDITLDYTISSTEAVELLSALREAVGADAVEGSPSPAPPADTLKIYQDAIDALRPPPLHFTATQAANWVPWSDWLQLYKALEARQAALAPGSAPDMARLLGWGTAALAFLLHSGLPPVEDKPLLDRLCIVRLVDTPQAYPAVSFQEESSSEGARVKVRLTASQPWRELPALLVPHVRWMWRQREGSVQGERLLPRRLYTDLLLRRLSRGPLKQMLGGSSSTRVLTVASARTAWLTHHLHETLSVLDTQLQQLGLETANVPALLQHALWPAQVLARFPVSTTLTLAAADGGVQAGDLVQEQGEDDEELE